jgi:CheY-like chemotaxis protein
MGLEGQGVVLLVEDDADHAALVMRSFEEYGVPAEIRHVSDGEEALSYLYKRGVYADSPRPDLILLDLRLPKLDGIEVLREIKHAETLQRIPAVILTTSDAERDLRRAYAEHANSYLVKPVDYAHFSRMMDSLGLYWLSLNRHPSVPN